MDPSGDVAGAGWGGSPEAPSGGDHVILPEGGVGPSDREDPTPDGAPSGGGLPEDGAGPSDREDPTPDIDGGMDGGIPMDPGREAGPPDNPRGGGNWENWENEYENEYAGGDSSRPGRGNEI